MCFGLGCIPENGPQEMYTTSAEHRYNQSIIEISARHGKLFEPHCHCFHYGKDRLLAVFFYFKNKAGWGCLI